MKGFVYCPLFCAESATVALAPCPKHCTSPVHVATAIKQKWPVPWISPELPGSQFHRSELSSPQPKASFPAL